MISLETFYPLVSGQLPNCPDMILREALLEACSELAMRGRLLMDDVSVKVKAGNRFATLESYEGDVFEITRLTRDGNPLDPSSRHDIEERRYDIETGTPNRYYLEQDGRLVLGPVPEVAETLLANVLYKPKAGATDVADTFYRDWRLAVAAGARAYVRRNHGTWANSALEMEDSAIFGQAISSATLQRAKGRTNRRLRTRGHYY